MAALAMIFGYDPMRFLRIKNPTDSIIVQAIVQRADTELDALLDKLATKIRNEVVDAFGKS